MQYKLHLPNDEFSGVEVKSTQLDIRADDALDQALLSWALLGVAVDEFLTFQLDFELSFLSEPQPLQNDTQGQIFTIHTQIGQNVRGALDGNLPNQAASGAIVVPLGGIKVQSGERIYLHAKPRTTGEGWTVSTTCTIWTKSATETRAIRRR